MTHKHTLEIKAVGVDRIRFNCKDKRCWYSTELLKQWVRDRVTGQPLPKRKRRYE